MISSPVGSLARKASSDVDEKKDPESGTVVAASEGIAPYSLSEEDNKQVLRKLDLLLMPLMSVTVLLQFLDKTSLNYANLLGVQADLGLHGNQYSWLGSVFYIGYLAASPVHGYFLQKLHLSRYTACNVVIWGVVLFLHAACFNYAGLVTCRLFLGILEAGITPSFILLTGRMYQRQEQVIRTSIWFSMNGWAQILGGLISYGILGQAENESLKRWKQLFLILGAVTVFFGVLVFFVMPADPATAKFLTERERMIAVERMREVKTGGIHKDFKMNQFWEALRDPRLYLFFFAVLSANVSNGGVTNFGTQIISNFGYSKRDTALIGMSTGASECVWILVGVLIVVWTKSRAAAGVFSYIVAIVGGVLMIALPATDKAGRMAGYAICFAYPVASPLLYSWLSSCISGNTKKIVFNVVLQLGYCTGNIIGPQTYRAKDAPNYVPAKITLIAMFGIAAACMIGISVIHLAENLSRDRKGELGVDEPQDVEFLDWTDKEMKSFRYPY